MDAIELGLLRIHSAAEEFTDTAWLLMQGCHPSILTSEPLKALRGSATLQGQSATWECLRGQVSPSGPQIGRIKAKKGQDTSFSFHINFFVSHSQLTPSPHILKVTFCSMSFYGTLAVRMWVLS